jgi:hypothetical protein
MANLESALKRHSHRVVRTATAKGDRDLKLI